MKTFAEQIARLEATREQKNVRMREIMQRASDEDRSTDSEESAEFDRTDREVKTLDADLKRLQSLERQQAETARPVADVAKAGEDKASGVLNALQIKKAEPKLAPGIAFARYARCKGISYKEHVPADVVAQSLYPDYERLHSILKVAVPAANTIDATWAANLVSAEGGMFGDFVEFLRPQTIIGKFGAGNVPNLRTIPFRTAIIGQTSGGDGYWVGEGKAKPLTSFAFSRTTLEPLKVANIAVATMELLRSSSPSADTLIRDGLAAALRERADIDFIDPGKTAVSGISPASILNAATAIPSSGSDAEDVRADIMALFAAFIAANNPPSSGVWIMHSTTALALSLMQNPLGQTEFPGIAMSGGTLFGLPAIVSEYVDGDTEGNIVALVNASDVYLAQEGGVDVKVSDQASLEMDTAPTNSSAPSGAVTETTLVSLWQTNSVGFLAEWTVNWALRRPEAAQYLSNVTWGQPS